MFKIKFRVMTQHTEEACEYMRSFIRENNIEVYECREAKVLKDIDNSWVEDLYYLCCRSNVWWMLRFIIKHKYKISFDERTITLW